MDKYTRLIEDSSLEYWTCEKCDLIWCFNKDESPQENDFFYCCKCGREIIEYVTLEIEDEGEEEC